LLWAYKGPKNYTYEDIEWEWGAFFDLRAKNIDKVGYFHQLLEPVAYDDDEQHLILIAQDKYKNQIALEPEILLRLEWEFSNYMKKFIKFKINVITDEVEEIPF
jgi:hypothetical protein